MTTLTARKCSSCGHVSWPGGDYCPAGCGATTAPATLANAGSVYVSTVIDVPHESFGASYRVGYVDLDGGPRVFGHFDSPAAAEIGTRVGIASPAADGVVVVGGGGEPAVVVFRALDQESSR